MYNLNWLANVVMVKKANGKWRMCVDFTDLNKAFPKESYPLSLIDILVDSTARHQLLSFMDAFSSYNQIKLDKADQEKTSFITSQGLFYYKVMSFGLKNAGATYQNVCTSDWEECVSLRGRHAGKKHTGRRPFERPSTPFGLIT